jgi:hypothetical protein
MHLYKRQVTILGLDTGIHASMTAKLNCSDEDRGNDQLI